MIRDFKLVSDINVTAYVEKKANLSYLSWAYAWKEFCLFYPDATYVVVKNENNIPVFGDDKLGYMVYTEVTVGDLTHQMFLPVMNHSNRALKTPDIMDINKAVMRCLTKNLAMFGLGIALYTGEDLQDDEVTTKKAIAPPKAPPKPPGLPPRPVAKAVEVVKPVEETVAEVLVQVVEVDRKALVAAFTALDKEKQEEYAKLFETKFKRKFTKIQYLTTDFLVSLNLI